MVKDVDKIRRILVAPYPNSAFMFIQLADLLGSCDNEKDKKKLISNFNEFFKENFPSVMKLFPEYKPDDLFRAIQIVPEINYRRRFALLRNIVVLAITKSEELDFNLDENMDLPLEEFTRNFLLAIKKKRDELYRFSSKDNSAKIPTFSYAYRDYFCRKYNLPKDRVFDLMVKEKIQQYDNILLSSSGTNVLTSKPVSIDLPSINDAMYELSTVIDWSLFEPLNPAKLEIAMANRFIIDFNHYIKHVEKNTDMKADNDTINEYGPEYIDYLRKFVNDYNRKVRSNPKYGLSIKTIDLKTGQEVTITHEVLVKRATRLLANYPDALDMGDPLQYEGISYEEMKDKRREIIEKAKEEEERRVEEEKARIEKERIAKEKAEALRIQLDKEEEKIDAEINEQAVLRNEKIDELLEKINMLKQATEKHLDKYKVDKEELEIWQTLLIEEKRTKAREAAVQIVKIGGKLFTPSEAQELQLDSRNTEHDVAEKNKDKEALERLDELARRQEFYYNNLGIVAVIKFDDMDIYVSSSGCLYTEPANQSGVGHNAVYVLHYTNARQLFSRKIVKQEVRSERNCNEGSGIKYFPHIDGWEERLIDHNNKSAARNTDPEGVVQFINDMQNELVTNNQKMKVFGCGNASNTRTAK